MSLRVMGVTDALHYRRFPIATAKQRVCGSMLILLEDDEEDLQVTKDAITMLSHHYGSDVAAATWGSVRDMMVAAIV
jgi:hypothetical protein